MRRTAAALATLALAAGLLTGPLVSTGSADSAVIQCAGTPAVPACALLDDLATQLAPLQPVLGLAATDVVVWPRDGVVQARDGGGAALGERRLQRILREAGPRGGLDLGDAALAAVRAHVGTAPLDDDLLIVTVAT
ncbi:MAG: hypothetical protein ABL966_09905 [Acidimicrobiales bacterium]